MPPTTQLSELNVSDLMLYYNCPRQVYYINRGFKLLPEMTGSRIERMLQKELALACPDIIKECSLNADNLNAALEVALKQAFEDISLIYPHEFSDVDQALLEEGKALAKDSLPKIRANLLQTLEEYGKENYLCALTPVKTEPYLSSERLNLKGTPSKLVCFEGKLLPSLIKTGSCPTQGVWASDRFHVTALALLLEAQTEETVQNAFVEYAGHGFLRKVTIRTADRRQVLKICRRVEKIKGGFLPEKKEGTLCNHCSFSEKCNPESSSLFSKFF